MSRWNVGTHSGGVPWRLNSSKWIWTLSLGSALDQLFVRRRRFNEDHLKVNVHWQTCPSGLRKTWIIFPTFQVSFGFWFSVHVPLFFMKFRWFVKMKIPAQWRFHSSTLEKLLRQSCDHRLKKLISSFNSHLLIMSDEGVMCKSDFWRYVTYTTWANDDITLILIGNGLPTRKTCYWVSYL